MVGPTPMAASLLSGMVPGAGPAEGASYWASLLSNFAGHLNEEDQEDISKTLRKRNRTERAAAAIAGDQ